MNKQPQPRPAVAAAPPRPMGAPAVMVPLPAPEFTGERVESIIHKEYSGLSLVTGFRGKGKSSYAERMDAPPNILFIDLEDKEENDAVGQLGVGAYFQPMQEVIAKYGKGFDVQAVYDRIIQIIEKTPVGRFTTLVIDNAQELNDGAAQAIRNDPALCRRFGVLPENALTGAYGGANPGAKHLIAHMLHLCGVQQIPVQTITFQLKPVFNRPGAYKTTDLSIWHERSKLTIALVDPIPQHYPNPRGLVIKEAYSQKKWNPDTRRIDQIRRLPPALPSATPYAVYDYLDHPWDIRNPKPGETVTAVELAPYVTFSNEQLMIMEKIVAAQEKLAKLEEKES